jgi:hypothetical protein
LLQVLPAHAPPATACDWSTHVVPAPQVAGQAPVPTLSLVVQVSGAGHVLPAHAPAPVVWSTVAHREPIVHVLPAHGPPAAAADWSTHVPLFGQVTALQLPPAV